MRKSANVQWSESLRRKATRLIASCGLLKILRKYGQVRAWGSYDANLMMHGDIDFHVVRPNGYTVREVLKAYCEVVLTDRFTKHMLWKCKQKLKNRSGIRGYYTYFEVRWGGKRWKIDVWFLDAAEQAKEDRIELNAMKMHVTPKQRETILAFKELRNRADVEFSSQRIYELVLMNGMTSRTEFKRLLTKEKLKQ
jgi:hypothetical protein